MTNHWSETERIRLLHDCELGQEGNVLHVLSTDGPYMTVRREGTSELIRTRRDYADGVKVGEAPVDDAVRLAAVANVVDHLHETSERAPGVRSVPMCLVHQDLFDQLIRLVGRRSC